MNGYLGMAALRQQPATRSITTEFCTTPSPNPGLPDDSWKFSLVCSREEWRDETERDNDFQAQNKAPRRGPYGWVTAIDRGIKYSKKSKEPKSVSNDERPQKG